MIILPQSLIGDIETIKTKADFGAFRARLAADPEGALDWSAYRFDTSFPLLGQPDGVVASIAATGAAKTLGGVSAPALTIPSASAPKRFPIP